MARMTLDAAIRKATAGFTLLELLAVMSLVGVMMAMVAPRIDTRRFRVDATLQNVSLTLNAAQRLAVLNQHDIVIAFDRDGGKLRVHRDTDADGVVGPGESARWVELESGVTFGRSGSPALLLAGGDQVTFTGTQDGYPAVTFLRNGSSSEYGYLYLTAGGSPDPSYDRAIEVERATGQVRCLSYETSTWGAGC